MARDIAERAMDAAACIGCGAKIAHLAQYPQGQPERYRRVVRMVEQMDAEGFGSCSNEGECEAACPKEIQMENIALMNRDYFAAMFKG